MALIPINIILEDDHTLLRTLELNDLENLLPFSLNEPELWKYSLLQAGGKENLEKYIATAVNAMKNNNSHAFIVFDKVKNAYAGSTRFYDIEVENKMLLLGYTWYGKDFQGTGLNKHCKFLLLQYAFEILHMERVEFRADNRNEKSKAAMLSIGCKVDGVLRNNLPDNMGGRRDSIVLSILKDEWFGGVKETLQRKLKMGNK